ncbi:energy transducer TonB [Roseisolibacter sp. H3M3-2]|uniref:energy transducer TonB n=1 Tax=Roseisolibacter sp. H3M3-2 TaxID=3031323 RepID=UPI0023D9A266|nr:energy transducer TonB [Roseisolibacter sp. H3M3-2]MDF1502844.1 energy transducer TonB [Roseisolibacter sp. H3M3-2]
MPSSDRRVRRLASAAAVAFALCAAPRLAAAQGEVYGGEDLSSPPKLVSAAATARLVARSFPEDLRTSGKGGTVNVQFVIGKDGKVEPTSIEVLETPAPALGTAAKSVVEKMMFVPGKKDGSAVRARVQLPIVYKP